MYSSTALAPVAVVKRSERDGVDVDYLFLQVFVDQPIVLGVLVGSFFVLMSSGFFPLLSIPMLVFTVLALGTAHQVLRV